METITVYYREESEPSLQAINWLKQEAFSLQLKKMETITHRDIFQLIFLLGLDISDLSPLLRKPDLVGNKKDQLSRLRFSERLTFLEQHPELLQDPIILSNMHSLSGYDEQKIKTFLL